MEREEIEKEDIQILILLIMIVAGIIAVFFFFPIIIGIVAFLTLYWYITLPVIGFIIFGYYYYQYKKKGRRFTIHINRDSIKYVVLVIAIFIVVPILFFLLGIAIDVWLDYTPPWMRYEWLP